MSEHEREVDLKEGRDGLREAALGLIVSARDSLWIASPVLEPALFHDVELIEALKYQLLEHRRLKVRLLISEPRSARRNADRLLALMRRLPSQFLVHQPARDQFHFENEIWLADNTGFLKRESPKALYTSYGLHAPTKAKVQRNEFEDLWHNSVSSPEFRQLV